MVFDFKALKLRWLRHKWKKKFNGEGLLLDCWNDPLPSVKTPWRDIKFLAVDTETSSLEADEGDMLSIGWVECTAETIDLATARHYLLRSKKGVGQSAVIHQLRDCELEDGLGAADVLEKFLTVARGKVLIFHHAPLDIAFLNKLCFKEYGVPLLLPVVDTLEIEKRKLQRRDESLGNGKLRLASCRQRYSLPDYPAHNALVDALATAELLMAQVRYLSNHCLLEDLI